MTPESTAALKIAHHIREVARLIVEADAETIRTLTFGGGIDEYQRFCNDSAAQIEERHPFAPVSGAQRRQLVEELADCVSDLSRYEIAEEILNVDANTEADWRMLADEKIDNIRFDIEQEDDDATRADLEQQIADFEALAEQE